MKRIRNIRDLEFEKLKLRVKQLELERQMERSWTELSRKLSFDKSAQQKSTQQSHVHFKTGSPLLSGVLNLGASFLSHKLGLLAGKKIEDLAEQALGKLSDKFNASMPKKKKA